MSLALSNTMGALLGGAIMSGLLYGVSSSQVYDYFVRYSHDRWHTKLLVAGVLASITVHQALIYRSMYVYLIKHFADPTALSDLHLSITTATIFNSLSGFAVQSYFATRIWRLSERNLYLVVPVMLLVAVGFASAIAYTIQSYALETFAELSKLRGLSICANISAVVSNLLICIIFAMFLHNSRLAFSKSNTSFDTLMICLFNTGLATSVVACVSLVTFFVLPDTFLYICFYWLMGPLYYNSLMATLNARKIQPPSNMPLSLGNLANMPTPNQVNTIQRGIQDRITIRIETAKEIMHEASQEKSDSERSKHPMDED